MPIPHSKPWITEGDRAAVGAVLATGMIAQGALVERLEERCARLVGASGGVATSSGTSALVLALHAVGVRPGSEVVIPTYVCRSVADAVAACGASPRLCDVGEAWLMTPETVAAAVTERTSAIVLVHTFGVVADVRAFARFGVPMVEDCCQAFGGRVRGVAAGSLGAASVFSFHATKCLTTGEGGMATSPDPTIVSRMRRLRDGAERSLPRSAAPLSDLQAALGLSQLERYPAFLERRAHVASRYCEVLGDLGLRLPDVVHEASMFFRFPVRTSHGFDRVAARFSALGVHVRRGVDALLHRQGGLPGGHFPTAERLFDETVSLPIYPALRDDEVEAVVAACREVWSR